MSHIFHRRALGSHHVNCGRDLLLVEQVENVVELQLFKNISEPICIYNTTPDFELNRYESTHCVCISECKKVKVLKLCNLVLNKIKTSKKSHKNLTIHPLHKVQLQLACTTSTHISFLGKSKLIAHFETKHHANAAQEHTQVSLLYK